MFEKLDAMTEELGEVESKLGEPDVLKDQNTYKELMQKFAQLKETVDIYNQYKEILQGIEETQAVIDDSEDKDMKEMAEEELAGLEEKKEALEQQLKKLLIPKDPLDKKNIIMEIRAGTGGDEASLFAADLYRMYSRYAEKYSWKAEILDSNPTEVGGFKEITFAIKGKNVYENLRWESGVHRVQRVPSTESGGRIHTSAVTVAVLPEAEETEVEINQNDIRLDVFRSSGPGGQSVNTTDSAVRLTHIPTGLVVTCQDEKSQHKNRAKAMRVLRARLFEMEEHKKQQERSEARKKQIGSGDRSERIRTYNFPQNRVTDHRINLTLYKLDSILQGELDEAIEALKYSVQEKYLQSQK